MTNTLIARNNVFPYYRLEPGIPSVLYVNERVAWSRFKEYAVSAALAISVTVYCVDGEATISSSRVWRINPLNVQH